MFQGETLIQRSRMIDAGQWAPSQTAKNRDCRFDPNNNKFPQLGNIGYQDNFQSQTKTSTDP